MRHIQCITPDSPAHGCMDLAHQVIIYLAGDEVKDEDKIRGSCCLFKLFEQCIRDEVQAKCGEIVEDPEEAGEYLGSLISSMLSDVQAVLCGRLDTLERCYRDAPELTQKLIEIMEENRPRLNSTDNPLVFETKSLLVPTVDMYTGLSID